MKTIYRKVMGHGCWILCAVCDAISDLLSDLGTWLYEKAMKYGV